jgi:alpha-N-arabinofuranosidase
VLGLLRELRLGVLRWPGGNFVSSYHWADGIGPKDARPRRPELAWGGEESNWAERRRENGRAEPYWVTFAVDADRLHFFDPDTGRAIG